jgi:4-diphosphocytidyl-2-C-methyl-D-erythritol kinase|tara:strand:+ start:25550 stop:26389 length:840 start_codon:yes stop_codon:yes gene_type:complete
MKLSLPSPSKINLFLHITGRRENGYHTLQTLFQLLDYGDRLDIESDRSGKIQLLSPMKNVPDKDNLIFLAAQAIQKYTGCALGAKISLDKRLPIGGGLGGGSSNAATTLLGLNVAWRLNLSNDELLKIGANMGADIPVFIFGYTAWAEGIGEELTAIERPTEWFLVLIPNTHISTAEIFAHQSLTRNTHPIKIPAFIENGGKNDCQPVAEALYPEVKKARQWLDQFAYARLTGTGACLFASFASETEAKLVLKQIPMPWQGFVAKGINKSPLLKIIPPE